MEHGKYPMIVRRSLDYFYVTEHDHDVYVNVDLLIFPRHTRTINSPEYHRLKIAMDDEMQNFLKENKTCTLTPLPEGKQAVGCRWVYAIKESSDGFLTHKARYVALSVLSEI